MILEKDERQKWLSKYNWLYLFIVAQETFMFMVIILVGIIILLDICSLGRGIHVCLLETLTVYINTIYINFLLLHNKNPQIQQLKTDTHLLSHNFYRLEVWAWHSWVFCWASHKAEIKVLARLCSHLVLGIIFRGHSGCWQTWIPCSCRLKFPFSYWLLAKGLSWFLEIVVRY